MLALLLVFLASLAFAAPSKCPQYYLGGQAPDLLNPAYSQKTQEICYSAYGLIHSAITRTPLVSAEHLTRAGQSAPHPPRKDEFHPEPSLPPSDRAELKDYGHSGYDRGHMSPAGDMPDKQSEAESYSLANMIPQNPQNNRNLWEGIEEATRELAKTSGELYVITGPIFYGSHLQRLNGRVLVPDYIFKAIYDPSRQEAAAYLVANAAGGRYAVLPIATVEKLSGLAIFPVLEDKVKQTPMALPQPRPYNEIEVIEDKTIVPEIPSPEVGHGDD